MVEKIGGIKPKSVLAPRGGRGTGENFSYGALNGIYGNIKCFNKMILHPGAAIGFHTHVDDAEAYLILEGGAFYDDDGTVVEISRGDLTFCPKGSSHGVEVKGSSPLVFMAFILE